MVKVEKGNCEQSSTETKMSETSKTLENVFEFTGEY